jgi:dynein heavy chain
MNSRAPSLRCRELVPTLDISLPVSLMSILEALLAQLAAVTPPQPPTPELLQGLFTFALVWSIGGSTDSAGRAAFDGFLRKLLAQQVRGRVDELGQPAAELTCPPA